MKGLAIARLIGALHAFVVLSCHAQDLRNYQCNVERISTAGSQDEKRLEQLAAQYVGKTFSVDRRTGVMTGVLRNSYITRPEVIDAGSSENSFKAVTTLRKEQGLGPGSNVHVLVVREYDKARAKPFVFLDNDQVYYGTCVHV